MMLFVTLVTDKEKLKYNYFGVSITNNSVSDLLENELWHVSNITGLKCFSNNSL